MACAVVVSPMVLEPPARVDHNPAIYNSGLARSLATKVNLFFALAQEMPQERRLATIDPRSVPMTAKRGPTPRQGILDIAPYVPGTSALPGAHPVIKLSSNESP